MLTTTLTLFCGLSLGAMPTLRGHVTMSTQDKPAQAKSASPPLQTFEGNVLSLAEALKKAGVEPDPDAPAGWLALVTADARIYPIIQDVGGRTFYRDPRLLSRPMRIQGRLVPGSQLLQVLQVHSLKDDKPHEVFYWCEVCSIKRFALEKTRVCECCGGPMELRETLVDKPK